eukprot:TRINITY_DN96909_c0_g1_i1.p1 TRINITY_DN96909_c0_g1~~TRINITY_DN96909_c0_g1_i1.p1  ORF type:complete len:290 (-),score=81.11 TRINITY_DN96909_c0_g1_i1:48-917(-)
MSLPAFGSGDNEEHAPLASAEGPEDEAQVGQQPVIADPDDELQTILMHELEDDVQAQVKDFLAQLPAEERQEVIQRTLERLAEQLPPPPPVTPAPVLGGHLLDVEVEAEQVELERAERVEESCEFLLRLLAFCSSKEQSQAVLRAWLSQHKTGLAVDPPSPSHVSAGDEPESLTPKFLSAMREQRLSPVPRTPATTLAAAEARAAKCFGRGPSAGDACGVHLDAVAEAFRAHDANRCGKVEKKVLAGLLKVGGIADHQVEQLLQAAPCVSNPEAVDYEVFLRWAFEARG